MLRRIFLIVFLLGVTHLAHAVVNPPELACISVNEATGNVVLNWVPPTDPNNEFVDYVLQWSTSQTGPFNDIVINNINTSNYTHVVDANLNTYYYSLNTIYNDGSGVDTTFSNVYRTIYPGFFSQTDSTATITWNPISTPNLVGNSNDYDIYRRIGGVGFPWILVGTTSYGVEQFIDTFKVCSESIAYKIEMENTVANCTSASSIIEDLFEDNTPPEVPAFDSVSVDPVTGNLILGWQPSESPDTRGYQIIYRDLVAGQNIIIDSTIGRFNTTYIDALASGNTDIRQYGVAAFDTCEKGNPPESNVSSIDRWHRTVFLEAFPNYCGNSVNLQWFNYVGWDTTISHYEILVSENGSPFTLVDTVSYPDSTFTHDSIDLTNDFCYLIRAVDKGRTKTSSSNYACPAATGSLVPTIHYLRNVTVLNNQYVLANVTTDSSLGASFYVLNRSLDTSSGFFEVARIPFEGMTNISLIDSSARVSETDYFYKVSIEDSCGFTLAESNTAKTVYLKGDFDKDFYENNLQWTPYYGWETSGSTVNGYQVFRILNHEIEPAPAADLSGFTFDFRDNMRPLMSSGLQVCYFIQANESSGNVYGF